MRNFNNVYSLITLLHIQINEIHHICHNADHDFEIVFVKDFKYFVAFFCLLKNDNRYDFYV